MVDAGSARAEAVRFAGALLANRAQVLWEGSHWRMLVTDESAAILFTIEVSTLVGTPSGSWPDVEVKRAA